MHVFGIFPSISCIFLVVNHKGFVIFVGTLSSGEELCGLGAFCVGWALESGEVLAESLGGACDCGDGGIQGNDTRDGGKLERFGVGILSLCGLCNLLDSGEARWIDWDEMKARQVLVVLEKCHGDVLCLLVHVFIEDIDK